MGEEWTNPAYRVISAGFGLQSAQPESTWHKVAVLAGVPSDTEMTTIRIILGVLFWGGMALATVMMLFHVWHMLKSMCSDGKEKKDKL